MREYIRVLSGANNVGLEVRLSKVLAKQIFKTNSFEKNPFSKESIPLVPPSHQCSASKVLRTPLALHW